MWTEVHVPHGHDQRRWQRTEGAIVMDTEDDRETDEPARHADTLSGVRTRVIVSHI